MNQIRVLLVEDDEDDFILTESLLSEIGAEKFNLEWANSYETALSKIADAAHDVCLLDYRLGLHNGLDLLREARARQYASPIIFLTGQNDREVDVEAMRSGAADYLVKGQLNAAVLERSIRYALEQKRIEGERIEHIREQAARAQAEAANRAKDEFLAMVSHELRTPLHALLGWTQILQLKRSDEATLERALEAIERNAKIQAKLVEDLIDITRITGGTLRIETRPFDLSEMLQNVVDEMRPAAEAKNIRLTAALEPSEKMISGDADRLRQVFNNLLSNAVKFTPDDGRVEINFTYGETHAEITVSDTGKGIEPDFLPFVFDRYRQAADSDAKRQGGLGLGLAIAREIVQLHRGEIHVHSAGANQGTIFTVKLPLLSE